jgi:hypothetical protein
MEKILESLVNELAVRVAKRIAENHEKMLDFLTVHPKPKLEDIEGLDEHVKEIAEEVFNDGLDGVEVRIDATLSR